MSEEDYGICKDNDSNDRAIVKKNYFSVQSQEMSSISTCPKTTASLNLSQAACIFSQATISLTSINNLESAPKRGIISTLSNQSTTNDQSKKFSFSNLTPTSELFGGIVGDFTSKIQMFTSTTKTFEKNEEEDEYHGL